MAVIYGISNVKKIFNSLKNYHFIEVMTCPNGCVGGAGQPLIPVSKQLSYIEARSKSLYQNDNVAKIKNSYENEDIKKIYQDLLDKPLSHEAEKLLHLEHKDKSSSIKILEK